MPAEEDEGRLYVVLINRQEQYSLWPKSKVIPGGWRACGFEGSKAECVSYVDAMWTDMRPLDLRTTLDAKN